MTVRRPSFARSPLPFLRIVLLGLAVLGVLLSTVFDLSRRVASWNPANLHDDPVTNWEKRIEPLKADLPKKGTLGYLSDWDLPSWAGSSSDMDNEYRLTQYALAPRLLVRGAGYAQIVANLTNPADVSRVEALFQVRKVRDYGFGIYLFAGSAP